MPIFLTLGTTLTVRLFFFLAASFAAGSSVSGAEPSRGLMGNKMLCISL